MEREAIYSDLRKQHEQFSRENYDGHNVHSGITGMPTLGRRRNRRIWNRRMTNIRNGWNTKEDHFEPTSNTLDS